MCGVALLEALIAFAVLALGTLGVLRIQATWGAEAAIAQQRSQALRIGQREIESLRAFAGAGAAPGTPSFAGIVSARSRIDRATDPTSLADYRITRDVTPFAEDRAKSVDLTVDWNDRNGATQRVALHSAIARADPIDSAALQVGSATPALRGAVGRAPSVPLHAKNLGDGRSAIKLASDDGFVVLIDDRSGAVVARCTVDARQTIDDLTADTLGTCTPWAGALLTGIVRFAPVGWRATQLANGAPLPLDIALAMADGPYPAMPQCRSEALKVVSFTRRGVTSSRAVPLGAMPASFALDAWAESGDRFIAYRCVVALRATGSWSGRSTLVPAGWTIGTGASEHRICRYVNHTDHSGVIDRNAEHTGRYVDVHGALVQQNFLVLRGDLACPVGDDSTPPAVDTALHQP